MTTLVLTNCSYQSYESSIATNNAVAIFHAIDNYIQKTKPSRIVMFNDFHKEHDPELAYMPIHGITQLETSIYPLFQKYKIDIHRKNIWSRIPYYEKVVLHENPDKIVVGGFSFIPDVLATAFNIAGIHKNVKIRPDLCDFLFPDDPEDTIRMLDQINLIER